MQAINSQNNDETKPMHKDNFQKRMAFDAFDGLKFEPEHYDALAAKGYITAPARSMPSGKEYPNATAGEVVSHPRLLDALKEHPISIEDMKRLLVIEAMRFDATPRDTICNILFARITKAYKAEKVDELRTKRAQWLKSRK